MGSNPSRAKLGGHIVFVYMSKLDLNKKSVASGSLDIREPIYMYAFPTDLYDCVSLTEVPDEPVRGKCEHLLGMIQRLGTQI